MEGEDAELLGGEGDVEWREGRTSGRGGDVALCAEPFAVGRGEVKLSSSRPQSFVTSHQNEYNELTAAANNLKLLQ